MKKGGRNSGGKEGRGGRGEGRGGNGGKTLFNKVMTTIIFALHPPPRRSRHILDLGCPLRKRRTQFNRRSNTSCYNWRGLCVRLLRRNHETINPSFFRFDCMEDRWSSNDLELSYPIGLPWIFFSTGATSISSFLNRFNRFSNIFLLTLNAIP